MTIAKPRRSRAAESGRGEISRGQRSRLAVGGLALCALAIPARAEIAYTALVDGIWQVYAQAAPSLKPRALRPGLGADASAPALSPDGSRIAFEVAGQGILVCPLDPADRCFEVSAERGSVVRPAWDQRSGELVVARYLADARGEDSEILMTRGGLASLGPFVAHTGNQDAPDVSHDGRLLVYSSAQTVALHQAAVRVVRHLWVMDLATGEARLLAPGAHQDIHPDVSPDGRRIAFASDRTGRFEIWVMDTDGTGLRQITSGPDAKTWPAWSPDGQSVLFTRTHDGREGLWRVTADGSSPTPFLPFGPGTDVQIRDPDWR